MEIAKTTVKKIMESLQENDFFNVIAVSKLYHVDIVYMYVRVEKIMLLMLRNAGDHYIGSQPLWCYVLSFKSRVKLELCALC